MRMPGITRTSITWDRKTWTRMAAGRMPRITVRYGCRMSPRIGRRIVMATGFTSRTTAGPGLATSHGAGPRITTGAGCRTAARGRGGRDRFGVRDFTVPSGPLPTSRSSDSAGGGVLVSVLDGEDGEASAGCPSGRVTASSRGGADMGEGSGSWALIDLAD